MSNKFRSHYVSEITPALSGKEITLAGWVHEVRDIGKLIFLQLRDQTGIIQVIGKAGVTDPEVMKAMNLPKESVVSIRGTVKESKEAKKGVEIVPLEVRNLNPLSTTMPFDVASSALPELDVRLNYRYVDVRRPRPAAIFRIESTILESFRNVAIKAGCTEIRPPCLVKEATEGGTDLFKVDYFGESAYLSQSPQLYKQLAIIGGIDRVFMIIPAFRAEKHNTTFHLNEVTQMDVELGFADHKDAIKLLKKTVSGIVKSVIKNNATDLETLGVTLKEEKVKEITYKEAVKKLHSNGRPIEFGQDFNREDEAELAKAFGDMLVVKEYPTAVRAFYSMPKPGNPEISNSYDFIYKGTEISSGAQRIHEPQVLIDALTKRGNDPKNFEFYINAFRNGAPPHAGWSIGLERIAMKITGADNIREVSLFPRDRTRLTP